MSIWLRGVKAAAANLARDPHAIAVGAIVLAFAAIYAVAGLVEHLAFRTALLDLGIYDQAVRGYAHFDLPRVPLFGVRTATDKGLLHWTDHFTPILALLTPLYWIFDGPETLLVAQGFLFALGIVPIWIFTRRALGTVPAYCVAVAFGLSWPIQHAVWTPFHQVAFAVPLMGLMFERYQAGRLRHAAWAALSLLTVREDLGLVVSVLGILIFFKGERKLGAWLAVGGVFAVWLLTSILIPLMGGSPRRNWSYWNFGRNPLDLAAAVLSSPLATIEYALNPVAKVHTLLWLFGPLLFLSLRSRLCLFAIPLLVVRFLSTDVNHWTMGFHYDAFILVPVYCSAIDGASQLPKIQLPLVGRTVRWGAIWGLAVLAISLFTLPNWPGWQLTHKRWWFPRDARTKAATAALARVPKGAFVAAANNAGIQLTWRAKVILWVPEGDRRQLEAVWKLDGLHWTYVGDRRLADAPWVFADVARRQVPFASVEQQRESVEKLKQRGYAVVYEDHGYVVLHRGP